MASNSTDGANTHFISTYDATTGAPLNAHFLSGFREPNFLTISGNVLYVSDGGTLKIFAYDAPTGAPLAGFTTINDSNHPEGIVDFNGKLLVGNANNNTVSEYDAATGTLLNAAFDSGLNSPEGLALGVPEPVTWATLALGAGALGLAALCRRVRRARCRVNPHLA